MQPRRSTRRDFLKTGSALAGGFWLGTTAARAGSASPNGKLDIGVVGVANRGAANLAGVADENVVALCDIDENYLAQAGERFPKAARYHDFRRMLDRSDLDAVVVSTPDHTHAVATMAAMKSGRDVYCEKPLTHSVKEARRVAETAARLGRVTQMGTQIHAGGNYRRVVELIRSGAIGPVREAHSWVGKTWSGGERPSETPPVPAHLHYDLWLGPAPYRDYHPAYLPANWRRWWDFGGGTIADMGCHHLDLPFWALALKHPTRVEAVGPEVHDETAPGWLQVRYEFPERKIKTRSLPPVSLTWHDGGKRPPQFAEGLLQEWGDGTLFVGDSGMLLADYGRHVLLPEADFADFEPPDPWIPDSIGHYREWIEACKTRGATTCSFDYAGPLTEAVLLGTVSYRVCRSLDWDPQAFRVRNCKASTALLDRDYREGWSL